jgi:hypothetical protein
LLDQRGDTEFLDDLEQHLFRGEPKPSLGPRVSVKLARAKALVQRLRGPRHLSVVFAVYKEHQCILPRSEHEIGEDFLRRKLRQLEWQFDCSPEFGWNLSVVYTDADLSTNLSQVGLLIDGIERGGADAAIGSRRQPTSVAVKRGQRNVRGKLFIFLWKRLLSPLRYITDTQCGFKVFRAEVVRDMLADVREKKFAFDLELLLKTELRRGLGPAGDPGTGDS